MGVFEAEAEEEFTAKAIEDETLAETFSQQLDENAVSGGEFNIFDWFENPDAIEEITDETHSQEVEEGTLLSLFPSTYRYAIAALQSLEKLPQT